MFKKQKSCSKRFILSNKKTSTSDQLAKALRAYFFFAVLTAAAALFLHGCLGPSSLEKKARLKPHRSVVRMKVTGYCPCGECCNWKRKWLIWPVVKSGPNKGKPKKIGICADGTKAKVGTIAADLSRYPFGTIMFVPGYGWGEVHDVGSDIKGNHIDVFFDSHKEATGWGVKWLNVTVYK